MLNCCMQYYHSAENCRASCLEKQKSWSQVIKQVDEQILMKLHAMRHLDHLGSPPVFCKLEEEIIDLFEMCVGFPRKLKELF